MATSPQANNTSKLQSLRGMNDIFGEDAQHFEYVTRIIKATLCEYDYQPFYTPILETTALFSRSIGEATDIVEKEMFTFLDHEEWVTLRPEATAGAVRAANQHGLNFGTHKLWTMGPMFRRERPQKGRYRQFHQFSIECFGFAEPAIDAEQILMLQNLWHKLGIADAVQLEINTLATPSTRATYRQSLVHFFRQHYDQLDVDSQKRLERNPLRILDSKNPATQALCEKAPKLLDHLDTQSQAHFQDLIQLLDAAGVTYQINPKLVRGLDYYNHTVFEWTTDQLGAQSTVAAGGRYDGLTELLGGKYTPCIGFAIGIERLILLMETQNAFPENNSPFVYIMPLGSGAQASGLQLANQLRAQFPQKIITCHLQNSNLKTQMKKADQRGCAFAVILGETELETQTFTLKNLKTGEQQTLPGMQLISRLQKSL